MSEMHHPRRVLRRIGAVLAGALAGIILSIGTDLVLHATGVFPPWPADGQRALPACDGLSHYLRRGGQLHRGAARARSAHGARPGAWRRGPCREHCGRRGDVGQGARIRARLVPPRGPIAMPVCLGGRRTPQDAVARADA